MAQYQKLNYTANNINHAISNSLMENDGSTNEILEAIAEAGANKLDKPTTEAWPNGLNVPYASDIIYNESSITLSNNTVDLTEDINSTESRGVSSVTINNATASTAGMMSSSDKQKLDGMSAQFTEDEATKLKNSISAKGLGYNTAVSKTVVWDGITEGKDTFISSDFYETETQTWYKISDEAWTEEQLENITGNYEKYVHNVYSADSPHSEIENSFYCNYSRVYPSDNMKLFYASETGSFWDSSSSEIAQAKFLNIPSTGLYILGTVSARTITSTIATVHKIDSKFIEPEYYDITWSDDVSNMPSYSTVREQIELGKTPRLHVGSQMIAHYLGDAHKTNNYYWQNAIVFILYNYITGSNNGLVVYTCESADIPWHSFEIDLNGGGSSTWGQITGTLSDQTDLQTVLDSKVDIIEYANREDATSSACLYGTNSANDKKLYKTSVTSTPNTIAVRASGGTITCATPTNNAHAATKKYVDDAIAGIQPASTALLAGKGISIEENASSLINYYSDSRLYFNATLYCEDSRIFCIQEGYSGLISELGNKLATGNILTAKFKNAYIDAKNWLTDNGIDINTDYTFSANSGWNWDEEDLSGSCTFIPVDTQTSNIFEPINAIIYFELDDDESKNFQSLELYFHTNLALPNPEADIIVKEDMSEPSLFEIGTLSTGTKINTNLTQANGISICSKYDNEKTYRQKDLCIYNGRVYEEIYQSSIGNLPTDTNYWKLYDLYTTANIPDTEVLIFAKPACLNVDVTTGNGNPDGYGIYVDSAGIKSTNHYLINGNDSNYGGYSIRMTTAEKPENGYHMGISSSAFGIGTKSTQNYMTSVGKYNTSTAGNIFEVGNGYAGNRSNAFSVTDSGKCIAGASTVSSDSNLVLVTKDFLASYVSQAIADFAAAHNIT